MLDDFRREAEEARQRKMQELEDKWKREDEQRKLARGAVAGAGASSTIGALLCWMRARWVAPRVCVCVCVCVAANVRGSQSGMLLCALMLTPHAVPVHSALAPVHFPIKTPPLHAPTTLTRGTLKSASGGTVTRSSRGNCKPATGK